jgi:hypothetical protein
LRLLEPEGGAPSHPFFGVDFVRRRERRRLQEAREAPRAAEIAAICEEKPCER